MYQYQQHSPPRIRVIRPRKIRLRIVTDNTKDRNGQLQNECEDRNGRMRIVTDIARIVTDSKYITTDPASTSIKGQ